MPVWSYIRSNKGFIENIKKANIPTGYKIISFDVKPLSTNVPLDRTINIILKRSYVDNKLRISISKKWNESTVVIVYKKGAVQL